MIDEEGLGIAYVSNADGNYEVYMVTVDETIVDASLHLIDFIRWDSEIQDRVYTIQFNFLDGSNKIIQIDLT